MIRRIPIPRPARRGRALVLGAALALWLAAPAWGQEPALPPGLEGGEAPALPPGLEGGEQEPSLPPGLEEGEAPALPPGLGEAPEVPAIADEPEAARPPATLSGFWEIRGGWRLQDDPDQREASIAETRLQFGLERFREGVTWRLTTDLLYDELDDEREEVDLETGEGFIDLREAFVAFSPLGSLDVKAGRQILTWGTGDLLFINDLFPKDFQSFFVGRDDAYLKAPSDALKLSWFAGVNLDVVYTPLFDADRFVTGERLSYYDPAAGEIVGRDRRVKTERPDTYFTDDEWALRLYGHAGSWELAIYGYDGFWKQPAGQAPATGKATFPRLSVYGASVRGPLGPGIAHAETGHYVSREDPDGDDPLVRNSEVRLLVGYEQELVAQLTAGVQYSFEHMLEHDAYREGLPPGAPPRDETREVATLRLTWLTLRQTLTWSLFVFHSPTDRDTYAKPKVHWQVDDHWSSELGANWFDGPDAHTAFAQLERNSNAYGALRYAW